MSKKINRKWFVRLLPVMVKNEALQGLETDKWARLGIGLVTGDASMPDDVVAEIIRVRHQYRNELGKYHATLKLIPENPYPMGVPEKWVHPRVKKDMKELGRPIP